MNTNDFKEKASQHFKETAQDKIKILISNGINKANIIQSWLFSQYRDELALTTLSFTINGIYSESDLYKIGLLFYRIVDSALQKLKKQGVIEFDKKNRIWKLL